MGDTAQGRKAGDTPFKRLVSITNCIAPAVKRGLPLGTVIATAEGLFPVEYLEPGDRVLTRAGMRELKAIDTPAPLEFELVFDTPQVVFADHQMIRSDTGERIN